MTGSASCCGCQHWVLPRQGEPYRRPGPYDGHAQPATVAQGYCTATDTWQSACGYPCAYYRPTQNRRALDALVSGRTSPSAGLAIRLVEVQS